MKIVLTLLGCLACSMLAYQPASARADAVADSVPGKPLEYLLALGALSYLELTDKQDEIPVRSHLVPLGAMEKLHGTWGPEYSERLAGQLVHFTWRVLDGFGSDSVVEALELRLKADPRAELLFSCDARACGSSAEWANTIFSERILYGRAESQRYRIYRFKDAVDEYRLLMYASARSSDRQYLRAELLHLD